MTVRLHYIYDPLCGWCYGAEPLASAAIDRIELVLHGGGLWPEPTSLPEATRHYIQQADARIAQLSGQPFGEAYLSGSLLDPSLVLDSRPTIAAILAAEALDPGCGLSMLRGIQRAHYVDGRRVVEQPVLCDIAVGRGLNRDGFVAMLARVDADAHINETRQLMGRVGAEGFPTFVLERDGALRGVPHQRYFGNTAGFLALLSEATLEARAAGTNR